MNEREERGVAAAKSFAVALKVISGYAEQMRRPPEDIGLLCKELNAASVNEVQHSLVVQQESDLPTAGIGMTVIPTGELSCRDVVLVEDVRGTSWSADTAGPILADMLMPAFAAYGILCMRMGSAIAGMATDVRKDYSIPTTAAKMIAELVHRGCIEPVEVGPHGQAE